MEDERKRENPDAESPVPPSHSFTPSRASAAICCGVYPDCSGVTNASFRVSSAAKLEGRPPREHGPRYAGRSHVQVILLHRRWRGPGAASRRGPLHHRAGPRPPGLRRLLPLSQVEVRSRARSLDVTVRSCPVTGVAAVGQTPSNSEPIRSRAPSLRRGHRPVLTVDNGSVRLARSHVHTGFAERLPLNPWTAPNVPSSPAWNGG